MSFLIMKRLTVCIDFIKQHILIILVILTAYLLGLTYYSTIFLETANQEPLAQKIRIALASSHFLFLGLPLAFCLSKRILVRIISIGIVISFIFYLIFLISYFKYFRFVPNIFLFSPESASDLVKVRTHYFRQVFGLAESFTLIVGLVFLLITVFISRYKSFSLAGSNLVILLLGAIITPLLVLSATTFAYGSPSASAGFGGATMIRRFGPATHLAFNYREYTSTKSSEYLSAPISFPGKLKHLHFDDSYTPEQHDLRNVEDVYLLQIESLDFEVIEKTLNGNLVMPFVNKLRQSCLSFSNFSTVKDIGGSADAEFSVITGLLPSNKRQSIRKADSRSIKTIFDILENEQIKSYFAHNNEFGYYGRNYFYKDLRSVSTTFLANPNESELDFGVRTATSAISDQTRSFYYFFNFQSHGPFTGYDRVVNHIGERPEDLSKLQYDYLRTISEVDKTIENIFDTQEKLFASGKSVVIITADHASFVFDATDEFGGRRVPLLICHANISHENRLQTASHVDLFPTILAMFNIEQPAIGVDLLSDSNSVVVFPDNTFTYYDNKKIVKRNCDAGCESFRKYTNQYIKP